MRRRIYTETGSVHELDTTAGTYVRLRVGTGSTELRRDGEPVPYEEFFASVGYPAQILLRLREDGVKTWRSTAAVLSIEELP